MDPSKVRESQKTKHFLSLLRIMAGSVWIILWLFLFSVYDPDSGNGLFAALLYPGIILFLFAADWTGRKVYCLLRPCHFVFQPGYLCKIKRFFFAVDGISIKSDT